MHTPEPGPQGALDVALRVEVAVTPRLLRDAIRVGITDLVGSERASPEVDQGVDVVIVDADHPRVAPLVIRLPTETGEPGRVLVHGSPRGELLWDLADIRSALLGLSAGAPRG